MTSRLIRVLLAGLTGISLAGAARAQDRREPSAWTGAKGWRAAMDRPAPDSMLFSVDMPPGWHITARGPGAVLGDTSWRVGESATVEAEIFLFPSSTEEGYGVFVGGKGIEAGAPSWTGFLLRKDGQYAVVRGLGGTVTPVREWTAHPAITRGAERPVKNVLSVRLEGGKATIQVNGGLVAELPVADVSGAAGIRVGEGVNLHVTSFTITRGN